MKAKKSPTLEPIRTGQRQRPEKGKPAQFDFTTPARGGTGVHGEMTVQLDASLLGLPIRTLTTARTALLLCTEPCPAGPVEWCDCRIGPVTVHHEFPFKVCGRCFRAPDRWAIHQLVNGDLVRFGDRRLYVCDCCQSIQDEQLLGPDWEPEEGFQWLPNA